MNTSQNSIGRLIPGGRDLSPQPSISYEQAMQDRQRLQNEMEQMDKEFRKKEANYKKQEAVMQ